jgi:hypothetical protein
MVFMPKPTPNAHVYELAKLGAEARLQDLLNEVKLLTNLFPDLRKSFDRDELPVSFLLKQGADKAARATGRRGWSPAQKKAAAARMKAYWAKKKAAKKV